jgi:hypothetical protein
MAAAFVIGFIYETITKEVSRKGQRGEAVGGIT